MLWFCIQEVQLTSQWCVPDTDRIYTNTVTPMTSSVFFFLNLPISSSSSSVRISAFAIGAGGWHTRSWYAKKDIKWQAGSERLKRETSLRPVNRATKTTNASQYSRYTRQIMNQGAAAYGGVAAHYDTLQNLLAEGTRAEICEKAGRGHHHCWWLCENSNYRRKCTQNL